MKKTSPHSLYADTIKARCVSGHFQVLSREQIKEAEKCGCAFCSECGMPVTVERVSSRLMP